MQHRPTVRAGLDCYETLTTPSDPTQAFRLNFPFATIRSNDEMNVSQDNLQIRFYI